MSKEPTETVSPAGGLISEDAVRAAFARRRPTSPAIPALAVGDMPKRSSVAGAGLSPSPREARRLRRWPVAELIARAAAARPSTT
jgi:hypothetical protein